MVLRPALSMGRKGDFEVMYYAIYVLALIFYFVRMVLYGADYMIFWDFVTLEFILIPCVLTLFCTKMLKAFGRSMLFALGRRNYSCEKCRESLQAVRMTMLTAVVLGMIGFLVSMVRSIRGWRLEELLDGLYRHFLDLSVAMLVPLYALLICLALIPVYYMLKRHLVLGADGENKGMKGETE